MNMANKSKHPVAKNDNNTPESNTQATLVAQQYTGPIPMASELEKYEQVLPGAADRILKMAEKNNENEIDLRNKTLKYQARDTLLGTIFTFFTVFAFLVVGVYLVSIGKNVSSLGEWVSLIAGAGTIASSFLEIHRILFPKKDKSDSE